MNLIRNSIFVLFLLISFVSQAFEYEKKLDDPAQEANAHEIFHQIRCIVCDGESLANSNADFSVNMRALVRGQLAEGKTQEEVISYLTERYGNAILQEPPAEGLVTILWLAPLLFFIIGILLIRRKANKKT